MIFKEDERKNKPEVKSKKKPCICFYFKKGTIKKERILDVLSQI
ncbi:hypothetical protein SAMD00020551_3138 [Mesobacillus selenatarsenatis SF-1]|uniref:Uncharacterized protein n=1 Tax=Mesobacillus selenatarsenatis (strain DSM 18680 / JCM 14380 / FERM P-15431 / SF-1) TaxID=1321606 RepID=A0A0A8X7I3_MESS1|nr:hypothetical protein SAMD00020551_3138 [Mesobacillus selenatarsenatis SF-1]